MRKLTTTLLSICIAFFSSYHAQAQVNVSVNIGSQPNWGPTGYDRVDYYYMPDIETYYYVPRHQFIYFDAGKWVFAASLPARYRSYDLYRGYKVVINEPRPYIHHDVYRTRYVTYREHYDRQPLLRDHRGRGHAYGHYKDHGNGQGNGRGNGHGKGHGKGHDN